MNYKILEQFPDTELGEFTGLRLYHRREWHQVLQRVFGWHVQCLAAYSTSGELAGVLPFVNKRRLSRRVNVALPLSHHVGFAYHPEHFQSKQAPTMSLEVHAPIDWEGGVQSTAYVITKLDLSAYADSERLFKSFNKSSIQRKIKKAQESQLRASNLVNKASLDAFTHLQALTRRRQGTPTYPAKFFHVMAEALGEAFKLYLVYQGEKAVAGIIFLVDGKTVIYGYGASIPDDEILRLGPNQLAMWTAIEAAYQQGFVCVDFGLSPLSHSSLREYKEKWAGFSTPLPYTYLGMTGRIERESLVVSLVSRVLQSLPISIFARLSPILMTEVL